MSTAASLLDRLNGALTYQELQTVFTEIASQAQAKPEDPLLARSIDEVVRRLEQERARDEQELREIQSRYESFQSQHQGVVGWFKRHLPFTETRRQEVEHRSEVADQQAEILADNLVIARAQMVKERLLGPAERKLGRRPPEWRSRFDACQAQPNLASLGEMLRELASEAERSGHFIRELKEDLEAFAGAVFKTDDDRRRRDSDLATARQELAALEREVEEETTLKTTGLTEVARRAADELSRTSASFQEDGQRLTRLKAANERLKEAGDAFDRLHKEAKEVGIKAKQLLDLPAEVQRAREAVVKVQSRQSAAAAEAERKAASFHAQRDQYERARQDQQQKQQLLASAQQFYDAWQAERQASGATGVEAEASPVAWRYQEAKSALEQAETELRRVSPSYEAAVKELETAQQAADAANKELQDSRQKIAMLEEKAPQLRLELASQVDRSHPLVASAAAALSTYNAAARDLELALRFQPQEFASGTYGWLGSNGIERSFGDALLQAQTDYPRHQQALAILERLNKWQATVAGRLGQEQKTAGERRESLWRRRCREVLGDALAEAACRDGLA
jgi:chromosome segregation ATPase